MLIGYCPNCKENVSTKREDLNICLIIILCIFTGGIGAIIYLLIYYNLEPNRCIHCSSLCAPYHRLTHNSETHSNSDISQESTQPQENNPSYCPSCGGQLSHDGSNRPKYCPYCGVKLGERFILSKKAKQCTICHEDINTKEATLSCSYCGSQYHFTCGDEWFSKYNSCPMCQNTFLNPHIEISENKRS